jgi:hypothetical protein
MILVRVDIAGHGNVPTLNITAPTSNVELNRDEIRFLLGYRNLLVSVANEPITITPKNLDILYSKYNGKQNIHYEKPEILTKDQVLSNIEETAQNTKYEKLPEITNDVVVEEKISEAIVDKEESDISNKETYEEPQVVIEESSSDKSDTVNDDTQKNYHNKKRNKKRNRNHED